MTSEGQAIEISLGGLCEAGQHQACIGADMGHDDEAATDTGPWVCACDCHPHVGEFE